jgi:hypothetical protein
MTYQLGTMMPYKEREESIPSFEGGRAEEPRAAQRERWASLQRNPGPISPRYADPATRRPDPELAVAGEASVVMSR